MDEQHDTRATDPATGAAEDAGATARPRSSSRFMPSPWAREIATVAISLIALIASILASRAANRREDDQTAREQVTRFRDLIAEMADGMSEVSAAGPSGDPADVRATVGPSRIEQQLPSNPLALGRVILQASEAAALLDSVADDVAPQELAFLGSSLTSLSRPRQGKEVLERALDRSSAVEDRVFVERSLGIAEYLLGRVPAGRERYEASLRLATPDQMESRLVAVEARWITYTQWVNAELYYNEDCAALARVVAAYGDDDELQHYFPAAISQAETAAEEKCG